jgi:Ca-activated chloride channel family protein
MRASTKFLRNRSRATNFAIVAALHVGAVLVFVGCAKPLQMAKEQSAPYSVAIVAEMKVAPPEVMMSAPPPPSPAYMEVASAPGYGGNAMRSGEPPTLDTAKFPDKEANGALNVADHPVSTFSVDVDTASYAFVRSMLMAGALPPPQAVRVEEMVNYFPYKYATPSSRSQPFGVTTEVMPSPWNAQNQLVHIAVRGYDILAAERPRANVVLLVDVSGSMSSDERLPLLQKSFRLFAAQLRDDDRVSIVTYAGATGVVLPPTSGKDKHKIIAAIDALGSGGGTAGAAGLALAYQQAERNFDPKAVNRVILATDGDFNIGISDPKELEAFIVKKRKTGVYLSIFGVGQDNLNDDLIQRLAQSGNGNAAYIDSLQEARKALVEELGSTMFPIANDVKVQVEFNPTLVASYRLVGYETRMLQRQDFKNDKVDAGDMGAGHSVTAIYEITPVGAAALVDPLRYAAEGGEEVTATDPPAKPGASDELCFVKLRYKLPGETSSRLTEHVVHAASARGSMDAVPEEQRFAIAVAAFAQRLRAEKAVSDFTYDEIAKLAGSARGADTQGYRAEFIKLVRKAASLSRTERIGQR